MRSPISLVLELGYVIAIPIVAFSLIGKLLDSKFQTSPLFLLLGVLLAMIATGIWLTQKTKRMQKELEDEEKDEKDK